MTNMIKKPLSPKTANRNTGWLLPLLLILAMTLAVLPFGVFAATDAAAQYIGEAKAKSIALDHVKKAENQVTFLKIHLDYDDRRVVYDIEFYSGDIEYDFEIDALDGRILEYDTDIEYYSIPNASSTSTNAGQYIGEARAKTVALAHANVLETQAVFIKAYLDYDDGRVIYDVEFYSGDTEYDYEIDAVSGDILESDMEIEYYSIPGNSAGAQSAAAAADTANYIGDAKAKSIALTHAGIAENQTAYIRVHLDYDDGRVDYDVEFISGNTEYEYEIDALNGTILEFDRETRRNQSAAGQTAQQNNTNNASNTNGASGANASYIGEAKAKSIALTNAGLTETQTRRMRVKLDREHGQMVYEIEFKSGQMEYEYEIDAVSGTIFEADREYDD